MIITFPDQTTMQELIDFMESNFPGMQIKWRSA